MELCGEYAYYVRKPLFMLLHGAVSSQIFFPMVDQNQVQRVEEILLRIVVLGGPSCVLIPTFLWPIFCQSLEQLPHPGSYDLVLNLPLVSFGRS